MTHNDTVSHKTCCACQPEIRGVYPSTSYYAGNIILLIRTHRLTVGLIPLVLPQTECAKSPTAFNYYQATHVMNRSCLPSEPLLKSDINFTGEHKDESYLHLL